MFPVEGGFSRKSLGARTSFGISETAAYVLPSFGPANLCQLSCGWVVRPPRCEPEHDCASLQHPRARTLRVTEACCAARDVAERPKHTSNSDEACKRSKDRMVG